MSDKHKKLEEDIAACPYPVFGLRESVYDLEYVDHYEEEGRFTICYQSRSKSPYQLSSRSLWTVSLESSLYVHEGPLLVVHDPSLPYYRGKIIREKTQTYQEDEREKEFRYPYSGSGWDGGLDIDGIRFLGEMLHTKEPIDMAGWCYSSESHHYHIDGKVFGLSCEEALEVLCTIDKIK